MSTVAAPDLDIPYTSPQLRIARAAVLAAFEKRFIIDRLVHNKGNVTAAAHEAGIERQHFQRMMKRYGISSEEYR